MAQAQFWQTCRRHFTKNPGSVLRGALPETLVLETWEAFEESTKIDFGDGDIAGFGADVLSLGAQRPPLPQVSGWRSAWTRRGR